MSDIRQFAPVVVFAATLAYRSVAVFGRYKCRQKIWNIQINRLHLCKVLALRIYPLREAKQVSFSGLCRGQGFALKKRIWHTHKFESEGSTIQTWHQQKSTMPGYSVRRNIRTTSTCPKPSKTGCCIVVLLGKMNNWECKR